MCDQDGGERGSPRPASDLTVSRRQKKKMGKKGNESFSGTVGVQGGVPKRRLSKKKTKRGAYGGGG